MSHLPRIGPQGYPLPPCYYELFTDEAKNDPNHPNHRFFTPPPPFGDNETYFTKYNSAEPLDIRQGSLQQSIPIYQIPDSVPVEFRTSARGPLARFHPDVDYKGELARLNKLLAQEYGYILQTISSPQPPTNDSNRHVLFEEHFGAIGLIVRNIIHLTGILREHQAKQQILAHVKKQTQLNHEKTARLKLLHEKFEALVKPDCDVDAVLDSLSGNPRSG